MSEEQAQRAIERLLDAGQSLVDELTTSSSFVSLVGRTGQAGRRDLQLIALWAVTKERRAAAAEAAPGGVAQSKEVAQEELRTWLLADDGEALLAEFSLNLNDEAPDQGKQRRGGRKRRRRR